MSIRSSRHDLPQLMGALSSSQKFATRWLDQVEEHGFALAAGPSGVGKTAIMHQLVLPPLRRAHPESKIVSFMPGDCSQGFFSSLWRAMGGGHHVESVEAAVRGKLTTLKHTILAIDGFDQVFAEAEEAIVRIIAFLREIVTEGRSKVVGALRSPFSKAVEQRISEVFPGVILYREDLTPDELRQVAIEGVSYFTPELKGSERALFDQVTNSVAEQLVRGPHALPFMHAYLETWKTHFDGGDHSFVSWASSTNLAQVAGQHAEETVGTLKPRLRRELESLTETLIAWDEDLKAHVRHTPYKEIQAMGPIVTELVDVLIYERILYVSGSDLADATVALSHPDILDTWSSLQKTVQAMRRDRSHRQMLHAQALRWDSNGRRSEDRWLDRELLMVAETLLRNEADTLPPVMRDFLRTFDAETESEKASTKASLRKRLLRGAFGLVAFFGITGGLMGFSHLMGAHADGDDRHLKAGVESTSTYPEKSANRMKTIESVVE